MGLLIGAKTAEDIKKNICSAFPLENELKYEAKGRDIVTGLPRSVTVRSEAVRECCMEHFREIVDTVRLTLEVTPPELAADIMENGLYMAGGGAYIKHRTFLRNCTVKNNTATASGGGLYCEGGLVMDNVITENSVTGSNGQGGGVYLTTCSDGTYSYSTNFRNCMVTNNVSSSVGGGIFINSGYCYTSTISGNSASSFGGGIYMSYGSIQQSEITGNTSPKTAGIYSNREYNSKKIQKN